MATIQQAELRPIPGCDGYFASADGQIYSARRGGKLRRLTLYIRPGDPYLAVMIYNGSNASRRWRRVHQLVARAFFGPCPAGCETRHLDGNKVNNAVINLQYGTRQENNADRERHGATARGSRHRCAKLHESLIPSIRAAHVSGTSRYQLARKFGVAQTTMRSLLNRKTWKHV